MPAIWPSFPTPRYLPKTNESMCLIFNKQNLETTTKTFNKRMDKQTEVWLCNGTPLRDKKEWTEYHGVSIFHPISPNCNNKTWTECMGDSDEQIVAGELRKKIRIWSIPALGVSFPFSLPESWTWATGHRQWKLQEKPFPSSLKNRKGNPNAQREGGGTLFYKFSSFSHAPAPWSSCCSGIWGLQAPKTLRDKNWLEEPQQFGTNPVAHSYTLSLSLHPFATWLQMRA